MNLLNKFFAFCILCCLTSCITAQDINIRRGGSSGSGVVDTNNFTVNGFVNWGYNRDMTRSIDATSYDIATNDYVVVYAGGVGGEFQLPDPATCQGRWLHIINLTSYSLSLVCADRAIVAPDMSGSGTLQIILPATRSIELVAVDTDNWWEIASQPTASGGSGSGVATNTSFGVFEGFLTNAHVIDMSVYQIQYYTNTAPTNNLSLSFTNAVAGRACQIYITGRQADAITNISYTWPGEARWFSWTNTYVSTNKTLLLSITPVRANLLHVVGKEDAR